MPTAIHISALNKTFRGGRKALQDVNLTINTGEMVALIGASGSGKSTLLRHMAGLMAGDGSAQGLIQIHGKTVQKGGQIARDIRQIREGIGFVFQQFNLVGRLPVIINVLAGTLHKVPMWRSLLRWFTQAEKARGIEALRRVGIDECWAQRASTLSGGQQQRAAIARAMVQGAKVVLADEPIASLDPESSRKVMDILARINREDRCTVVVSLHQVNVAIKYCPRTIALHQGRVVYDGPSVGLTPAVLRELYGADADDILSLGDHISSLEDKAKPVPHRAWPVPLAQAA
ncbi:phosphonate ABC transporter ATP-binding protein [Rhodoferax antarcticus]|uniref:Putative phosphonate ABC transporter, ATP-binding protein n=1 Tax=Rhodoferax antarcticus ANT.BR TaxID=1111071 RepID=A0A1Q8YJY3_9BURK|nr:phosphonate ABC transporter ATP-binding protein [Rhodoferax antarcticus]APW47709.1 phosphonate ABC transporter ATP-binding protein [Rhodoferax antarcticus]OLP08239.1 putative phosphonate ABC transporter, ATP-binding protein [Rhodoferax antarcticus ANT.BR]